MQGNLHASTARVNACNGGVVRAVFDSLRPGIYILSEGNVVMSVEEDSDYSSDHIHILDEVDPSPSRRLITIRRMILINAA